MKTKITYVLREPYEEDGIYGHTLYYRCIVKLKNNIPDMIYNLEDSSRSRPTNPGWRKIDPPPGTKKRDLFDTKHFTLLTKEDLFLLLL